MLGFHGTDCERKAVKDCIQNRCLASFAFYYIFVGLLGLLCTRSLLHFPKTFRRVARCMPVTAMVWSGKAFGITLFE